MDLRDFNWNGLNFFQLGSLLDSWLEVYAPEITDQNPYEPFQQLKMAFQLIGHRDTIHQDIVAREFSPASCRLSSTMEGHAMSHGQPLTGPFAAITEVVGKLSSSYSGLTELIKHWDKFQTGNSNVEPVQAGIVFEASRGLEVNETDTLQFIFATLDGTNFTTNFRATSEAAGAYFSPFASAVTQGAAIYLGHGTVMFDGITVVNEGATPLPSGFLMAWEYYDGAYGKYHPASVTRAGQRLQFDLTPLLGSERYSGASVRVIHLPTLRYHDGTSAWVGGANVLTDCSLLGQTDPSLDTEDYAIGALWAPLPNVADGIGIFSSDGDLTFDLPQDIRRTWRKVSVNGVSAYWIRGRVVGIANAEQVLPSIDSIQLTGDQYTLFSVIQGSSIVNELIGTADGTPFQQFELVQDTAFPASITVEVDEGDGWVEWARPTDSQGRTINHFANSGEGDKHWIYERTPLGVDAIRFGSGTNGKRPAANSGTPSQQNVRVSYRYGSDVDGNVGADTIDSIKSGSSGLVSIYNPRPAFGWGPREGHDKRTFELTRQRVMARASHRGRGITARDISALVEDYEDADGTKPVARAAVVNLAREEGYMWVAVVPKGSGSNVSSCETDILQEMFPASTIEAIEAYLNGSSTLNRDGILFATGYAKVINYVPRLISVQMDLVVSEPIEQARLENAFRNILSPTATDSKGRWVWRFPGEDVVTRGRLENIAYIFPEVIEITQTPGLKMDLSANNRIVLDWQELPVLDLANSIWRQTVRE